MKRIHLLILLLFAFSGHLAAGTRPRAVRGVLDLQGWDLVDDGTVNLDGEWEFYWNRLLTPADFNGNAALPEPRYIQVPGDWNGFDLDGIPLDGSGVATFRLRVDSVMPDQILALDIPLMYTAYMLWADGEVISRNGVVGRSRAEMVPQYLPMMPTFVPEGRSVELVLQISNFAHHRGGIWQTLELGTDSRIDNISQLRTAFDMFLMGAILIIALYHFSLFAMRRKEGSTLFFGLFCLAISFRLSIHSTSILLVLFPDFPWELLVKLDYFVLYFGLIFFSSFIQGLYPQVFSRRVLSAMILAASGFILFTIFVPARVFTAYLVHYQLIMAVSCLYYLYVLIRATLSRMRGAAVMLGGCTLLIVSLVNDVLYNHEIIHTADLVGAGLFLMIFSQSFVLSIRFSRSFRMAEELSANLEEQVRERTAAIKDLLDNTGQGFLSFTDNYVVQRYTSRAVQEFFGRPIENENALELLFQDDASVQQEIFDLVFSGGGDVDMIRELLPAELERDSSIYQTDYHWIPSQGKQQGRIMIVLTDITARRELEQRLREDEERNHMIVKIAIDRHGFLGYLKAINQCMEDIHDMLVGPLDSIQPDTLFRYYHTIKGGLASYMFTEGVEMVHAIESRLELIRNGREILDDDLVERMRKEKAALEDTIQRWLDSLEPVLPRELIEAGDQELFHIPDRKIKILEQVLSVSSDVGPEINDALQNLRKQPVRNVLKKFADAARELGEKLNKPIDVRIKGDETEIYHKPFEPLFASLIHLIRNAVDHGIEPAEVRVAQDKPENGTISIQAGLDDGNLVICIADDGGGIDHHVVANKAVKRGLITRYQADMMSEDEVAKLIFKPGFSTSETVSDVSGWGVGLDAVATDVEALNGRIDIDSKLDEGTIFTLSLPQIPQPDEQENSGRNSSQAPCLT